MTIGTSTTQSRLLTDEWKLFIQPKLIKRNMVNGPNLNTISIQTGTFIVSFETRRRSQIRRYEMRDNLSRKHLFFSSNTRLRFPYLKALSWPSTRAIAVESRLSADNSNFVFALVFRRASAPEVGQKRER